RRNASGARRPDAQPAGAKSLDRSAHRRSAGGFGRDGARSGLRERGSCLDNRGAGKSAQKRGGDRRQGWEVFHRFSGAIRLRGQWSGSAGGRGKKKLSGVFMPRQGLKKEV